MFKHHAWKWLLLGGALTCIIMFGMEMSTSGIEKIYGPIEDRQEVTVEYEESNQVAERQLVSETERRIAELEEELARIKQLAQEESHLESVDRDRLPTRLSDTLLDEQSPAVDKLADSTSNLLQSASSTGIRIVATLFDGIIN